MHAALAHAGTRPAEAHPPRHAFVAPAGPHAPPERGGHLYAVALYAAAIDEIDHGIVVLDADGQVLLANRAAADMLHCDAPIACEGRRLRVHDEADALALQSALDDAARRDRRTLLTLGHGRTPWSLGVVPLPVHDALGRAVVQLTLPRPSACSRLTLTMYAQAHGLTSTEAQVLRELCEGESPTTIARRHDVALSTVRTQIGHIRAKTRTRSIRALVQQVGALPPLVGVLGAGPPPRGGPFLRQR